MDSTLLFCLDGSPEDDNEPTGTEAWVVAVAVLVPIIVIGIGVAGVFLYMYSEYSLINLHRLFYIDFAN